MSRNDDYGFIANNSYWEIGTEDARGRDGDDARVAAKKYNDHRHSAVDIANNEVAFRGFLSENKPAVNPGGLDYGVVDLVAPDPIRATGDLIKYQNLIWMYDSNGIAIPLGVGAGCYFEPNDAGAGKFVREAMTSQELICGRVEVMPEQGVSTSDNGVDVDFNTLAAEVGGVLLDMRMHNLRRARPMVRFECTGTLIHEGGTVYEALKTQNNVRVHQGKTLGEILAVFLIHSMAKAGEVEFIWDRNGDGLDGDGIKEFRFHTDATGTEEVEPLYLNDSTAGAVITQISPPILLNLNRRYVIRVRARIRTFRTNSEIINLWNLFKTDVAEGVEGLEGVNSLPDLTVLFGDADGALLNTTSDAANVYDKIRYWQSSDCILEILNVKIRIDNFLGLAPAQNESGVPQTTLTLPSDLSDDFLEEQT
jgi:hypothetical protein